MYKIIEFVKEQIEKMKRFFTRKKTLAFDSQRPRIEIKSRHDSLPTSDQNSEAENIPQITIHGVNQRTPIALGTSIYRTEVDVQNTNLGGGITVNRQRKPGRCPLCATRGGIIENPGGRPRWKCPACDSTFN